MQRAGVAVAPPLHHLAAPGARGAQAVPHHRLLLAHGAVGGRLQQRGHTAQHLLPRQPGDLAVGRVDVEHAQLGIGDQQALVQVLEQLGRQALPFLRAEPLADVGHGRHDAQRPAVGRAFHHQRARLEPLPARARVHAQLMAERVLGGQRLQRMLQPGPVVVVHASEPAFGRVGVVAVGIVEQGAPAVGGEAAVAGEVPVGHADVGAIERQLPALLGHGQLAGERSRNHGAGGQRGDVAPQQRQTLRRRGGVERPEAVGSGHRRGHGDQQHGQRGQRQPAAHHQPGQQHMRHEGQRRQQQGVGTRRQEGRRRAGQGGGRQRQRGAPAPVGRELAQVAAAEREQRHAHREQPEAVTQQPRQPGARRIGGRDRLRQQQPQRAVGRRQRRRQAHAARQQPKLLAPLQPRAELAAFEPARRRQRRQRIADAHRQRQRRRRACVQVDAHRRSRHRGCLPAPPAHHGRQRDAGRRPQQADQLALMRVAQRQPAAQRIRRSHHAGAGEPAQGGGKGLE